MSKTSKRILIEKDCHDFKEAFIDSLNKNATHIINPKTGRSIMLTSAVIADIIKECKSSFNIDIADIKKLQSKYKISLKLSKSNINNSPQRSLSPPGAKLNNSPQRSLSPPGAKLNNSPQISLSPPGAKLNNSPQRSLSPPGAKVTSRIQRPVSSIQSRNVSQVSRQKNNNLINGFKAYDSSTDALYDNDFLDKKNYTFNNAKLDRLLSTYNPFRSLVKYFNIEDYFRLFNEYTNTFKYETEIFKPTVRLNEFIKILKEYKQSCRNINKKIIDFDSEYIPHIQLLNHLITEYIRIIYDSYGLENGKAIFSFYMFDDKTLANTDANLDKLINNNLSKYIIYNKDIKLKPNIPTNATFQTLKIPKNVIKKTNMLYNLDKLTNFLPSDNNVDIIATNTNRTIFENSLLNGVLPFYYVINNSEISLSYNLMSTIDYNNKIAYNFDVKTRNIDSQKDILEKELYIKALYCATIIPKHVTIHMIATNNGNGANVDKDSAIKNSLFVLTSVLNSFTTSMIYDYKIIKKSTDESEEEFANFKKNLNNTNDKLVKNLYSVLKNNIFTYNYDYDYDTNMDKINSFYYNFGNNLPFPYISTVNNNKFYNSQRYYQAFNISPRHYMFFEFKYKQSHLPRIHSKDLNNNLQFFINEKVQFDTSIKERIGEILLRIQECSINNNKQSDIFIFHGTPKMLHTHNVDKKIYLTSFMSCTLNINTAMYYSKNMPLALYLCANKISIIYVIKINKNSIYINFADNLSQILLFPGTKINILGHFFYKLNRYILCEIADTENSRSEQLTFLKNLESAINVNRNIFNARTLNFITPNEKYPSVMSYTGLPTYKHNSKTFANIEFNNELYNTKLLYSSFYSYLPDYLNENTMYFNLKYTIHQCFINDCYRTILNDKDIIKYNILITKSQQEHHVFVAYKKLNNYIDNPHTEKFYRNVNEFILDCIFSNMGCAYYKNYYMKNDKTKFIRNTFIDSGIYSIYGSVKPSFDVDIEPMEHVNLLAELPYLCYILLKDGLDNVKKNINSLFKILNEVMISRIIHNIADEYNTNFVNKFEISLEKSDISSMMNKLKKVLIYRTGYYLNNIQKVKEDIYYTLLEMQTNKDVKKYMTGSKVGGRINIEKQTLIPYDVKTISKTKYLSNNVYQKPVIFPIESVNIFEEIEKQPDSKDLIAPLSFGTSSHKEFIRISNELYERGLKKDSKSL